MKLVNAARYFDKEAVLDAYSGALLFKGQLLSPAEHVSGDTFRRHTLSTADGVTMPTRYAVSILGDVWVLGNNNPDGFKGRVIRRNHSLKRSTGLLNLATPAQACLSTPGTAIHAYKEFYHDTFNTMSDASLDTMWNIYCPQNEAVVKGSFFLSGSDIFRARNVYSVAEGFTVAETDQFDADALQSAHFTKGAVNLATDTAAVLDITTPCIQTDVPKYYQFRTEAEPTQRAGDRTVFVPKSALTPAVGHGFTMLGLKWRTLAVVSEMDSWAVHARLA